jgi:hypothetical protein
MQPTLTCWHDGLVGVGVALQATMKSSVTTTVASKVGIASSVRHSVCHEWPTRYRARRVGAVRVKKVLGWKASPSRSGLASGPHILPVFAVTTPSANVTRTLMRLGRSRTAKLLCAVFVFVVMGMGTSDVD